jgi:hypothetical protein
VTEQEWLNSTDPQAMLRALRPGYGDVGFVISGRLGELAYRASDRKLRLFVAACIREEAKSYPGSTGLIRVADNTEAGENPDAFGMASAWSRPGSAGHTVPLAFRAALLREIFGNPYKNQFLCGKPATYSDKAGEDWYTCIVCNRMRTPTVLDLASGIYDDRAFGDMPVLADCLEEAGSQDAAILNHLRSLEPCQHPNVGEYRLIASCEFCGGTGWRPMRGQHVRGCWAISLILGQD